jgi:hypothetical protein
MLLLFRISFFPDHAGVSSAPHSGSCFQIGAWGKGDISFPLLPCSPADIDWLSCDLPGCPKPPVSRKQYNAGEGASALDEGAGMKKSTQPDQLLIPFVAIFHSLPGRKVLGFRH